MREKNEERDRRRSANCDAIWKKRMHQRTSRRRIKPKTSHTRIQLIFSFTDDRRLLIFSGSIIDRTGSSSWIILATEERIFIRPESNSVRTDTLRESIDASSCSTDSASRRAKYSARNYRDTSPLGQRQKSQFGCEIVAIKLGQSRPLFDPTPALRQSDGILIAIL